jgi:hypothetical protein
MDENFVVLWPTLRGENRNPGNFELLWGEIDDARAAIRWLAPQPFVDRTRIFAFGHSVGGGISALLSLHDDVTIRHSGSCGGLYTADAFFQWTDWLPFDVRRAEERELRVLLGNVGDMLRPHYAFVGDADPVWYGVLDHRAEWDHSTCRLRLIPVTGDHHTSLAESAYRYKNLTKLLKDTE